MIITKTYIDKINTLVKDSYVNLSLNPVMELNYGKMLRRKLQKDNIMMVELEEH